MGIFLGGYGTTSNSYMTQMEMHKYSLQNRAIIFLKYSILYGALIIFEVCSGGRQEKQYSKNWYS